MKGIKSKFKYLCIGFIMGLTFYACNDIFLQADEDGYVQQELQNGIHYMLKQQNKEIKWQI